MDHLADGFVYYVVFLFSTTVHEAAHAWAAKCGGDLTAYRGGQVTLDPRPHIRRQPFGMLVLPILSTLISGWPFGFASAPYDRDWAQRYPRRAGWMAVAGPVANLLLVVLAAVVIRIGMVVGVFVPPDSAGFDSIVASPWGAAWQGAAFIISVVFSLNLMLASLNMIPVPPLDGSAAVVLALSEDTARKYQQLLRSTQAFGMMGLLIAWRLFDVAYDLIFTTALNLLYPGASYG